MKKLLITEKQEKRLIELLSESDKEIQQMPVDKKMNKPYCVDPEKVLVVKKHLDKRFKPCKYTTVVGGRPNTQFVACMLDDDGNPLKYMFQEDVKDYLIDMFQKMFSDKIERELFMGQVLKDWFNGKIGVHGMLSTNVLKEGITYSPTKDGKMDISITTGKTDADNVNADTRVFGNKNDVLFGDGTSKAEPLDFKYRKIKLTIECYKKIISFAENDKKLTYNVLKNTSFEDFTFDMLPIVTKEAFKKNLNLYNIGKISKDEIVNWANISEMKLEVLEKNLESVFNRFSNKDDFNVDFKYGVSIVPETNVEVISLFNIDDFNFSDAAKHGELRQGKITDKAFGINDKKNRPTIDSLLKGKVGSMPLRKVQTTYDGGIEPDILNNFSYDSNGNLKNYGLNDSNYTTFTQFISKSIVYSNVILNKINYIPNVIVSPPSSSKYNDYFCKRLSEKLGVKYIEDFFERNILDIQLDENKMLSDGFSDMEVEDLKGKLRSGVNGELAYLISVPMIKFADAHKDVFSQIKKRGDKNGQFYDFLSVKQLLCQMSANALINNSDSFKAIKNKNYDYLYKDICYKLSSDKYGGGASTVKSVEKDLNSIVHSRALMYEYREALKNMHNVILSLENRLNEGVKILTLLSRFKITKIPMRQRKYLSNAYVIASKNLDENGRLFEELANSKFLIFDEDMNSGGTLKLSIDAILDKVRDNENNIKCLVVGFSPKSN